MWSRCVCRRYENEGRTYPTSFAFLSSALRRSLRRTWKRCHVTPWIGWSDIRGTETSANYRMSSSGQSSYRTVPCSYSTKIFCPPLTLRIGRSFVRPPLLCLLYTSDAADERSSVDL